MGICLPTSINWLSLVRDSTIDTKSKSGLSPTVRKGERALPKYPECFSGSEVRVLPAFPNSSARETLLFIFSERARATSRNGKMKSEIREQDSQEAMTTIL